MKQWIKRILIGVVVLAIAVGCFVFTILKHIRHYIYHQLCALTCSTA